MYYYNNIDDNKFIIVIISIIILFATAEFADLAMELLWLIKNC